MNSSWVPPPELRPSVPFSEEPSGGVREFVSLLESLPNQLVFLPLPLGL